MEMVVLWEKVRSREQVMVIERLKQVYPRRTRRERRAYAKVARKAVRMGLLGVPVEEG